MRYLNLLGLFMKISILNDLQYRANFFVQIFQLFIALAVSLGGLSIVYSHTETLKGWSSSELLAIVGVYFVIGGAINMLIQPSMQRLMEDIRMGTLDYVIIKPVETQFLISIRQVQIWKVVDIATGLLLIGISLSRLGLTVSAGDAVAFILLLICGLLIVYSFFLMLATITFWFIKIDNILHIFNAMYEAGRWPVRIYPGWLEAVLTFLVPVAFAVTVPVEAITGRLSAETIPGALALTVGLLLVSHWFWRRGVWAYSGASA